MARGFQVGAPISFSGSASDPEDGDLSNALSWTSDRDGAIGSGAAFTSSALSVGTHQIQASVAGLGRPPSGRRDLAHGDDSPRA